MLMMIATTVPGRNPGVLQSLLRLGNFDAWFLDITAAGTDAYDWGAPTCS